MTITHGILLFAAGVVAGAINAVAGGGSFVSFPTLLFTGVSPVIANATNTLALWVGTVASTGAYRTTRSVSRRVMIPLVSASVIGGVGGAILLIKTPASTFVHILPWLLLLATLLFIFGKKLTKRQARAIDHEPSTAGIVGAVIFELFAATYGGYFGGGLGIMNLAMFAVLGMTDIHVMNKLKVFLGSIINGVATVIFVVSGAIVWPAALVMSLGAIVGGFGSATIAQKIPQIWVRRFVIATAFAMTVYFFYRAYR